MLSPVSRIIHSVVDKDRQLNLLVYPHDFIYEYNLAKEFPKHRFLVILDDKNFNSWMLSKIDWPVNVSFYSQIPVCRVDAIIVNDRINNIQERIMSSQQLHCPIICINHYTTDGLNPEVIKYNRELTIAYNNFINISTHEEINKEWNITSEVIKNYIPSKPQQNKENSVVTVGNFSPDDLQILDNIKRSSKFDVFIIGQDTNFTYDKIIEIIDKAKVYLNLNVTTAIPGFCFNALGCGCNILSNQTPLLSEYSIPCCKSDVEIIDKINELMKKQTQYTIHSNREYINKWNNIFERIGSYFYERVIN